MRPGLTRHDLAGLGDFSESLQSSVLDAAVKGMVAQPVVLENRARTAAAIDYVYDKIEQYERWRPTLFALSAVGLAVSSAMAYRRRKVPEAWALYLTTAGISGGMAWFTRPAALRGAPAAVPPPDPTLPASGTSTMAQILGWADRRADHLDQTEPGWQPRTWRRLAHDLGFGTMNQHARTLLEYSPGPGTAL